jgi:hypothetical protein
MSLTRRRKRNPGWFRTGHDPRRHQLTTEERRKGGLATARKFTVTGRWHLDWWDRCAKGATPGTDAG